MLIENHQKVVFWSGYSLKRVSMWERCTVKGGST